MHGQCTGQTKFADDIVLPRMLYAKILRSHSPHALIKRIDASKALATPGVFAVITGQDLPISYGILPVSQDEHALCVEKVRFIGDPVAAVVAIDEEPPRGHESHSVDSTPSLFSTIDEAL